MCLNSSQGVQENTSIQSLEFPQAHAGISLYSPPLVTVHTQYSTLQCSTMQVQYITVQCFHGC